MANKPTTSHPERTATEPRQNDLHRATICYIRNVNPRVRLLRLALPYAITFLPGQWLDVHIPALPNNTGGFTITSTPADASDHPPQDPNPPRQRNQKLFTSPRPYLELAIQYSPKNPPAAWLWRKESDILNQPVDVRVGGSFAWPPSKSTIQRAVFVAGGVGINPLISMLSHLAQPEHRKEIPKTIKLLYSTRLIGGSFDQVLFIPRLRQIFKELNQVSGVSTSCDIHLTDEPGSVVQETSPCNAWRITSSRITHDTLRSALGPVETRNQGIAAYVCGPPAMTDEFVNVLEAEEGMKGNVLCEKWW